MSLNSKDQRKFGLQDTNIHSLHESDQPCFPASPSCGLADGGESSRIIIIFGQIEKKIHTLILYLY